MAPNQLRRVRSCNPEFVAFPARRVPLRSRIGIWIAAIWVALFFSASVSAQTVPSVALVTDQTSLSLSTQFGVPVHSVVDAAGDYAFVGDGNTALFYRPVGATTVRLLQTGDAVPGFAGSQLTNISTFLAMNSAAHLACVVNFSLADGLHHSAVLTYNGSGFQTVASSDSAAPGAGGAIYGTFQYVAINDNGDVAFTATPQFYGDIAEIALGAIYIAPSGSSPVRIAGIGDTLQPPLPVGQTVEKFIVVFPPLSFNSAGQILFSAGVSGLGAGPSLVLGSASSGMQVVASTLFAAPTGGTFAIGSIASASLNNLGQVVFFATTSLGVSGTWQWSSSSGTINPVAVTGAPAPALLGGTLMSPSPAAFDDAGDILLSSPVTGSATTTFAVLRYHLSGGTPDLIEFAGESAPGLAGKSFSSSTVPSMANDGTASFSQTFNEGGHAIYSQVGTAAPALVAADGGSAPVAGGGTLSLANASLRSLGSGQVFFTAGISSGTAYYAEFLGASGSVSPSLMSTADQLLPGARAALPAFSAGTDGGPIAFLAQRAGGLQSLFEVNPSSGSTVPGLLVTEGAAAPGGAGPVTFSFPYVQAPDGQFIFTNQSGQVLLPATVGNGQALVLASPAGLTKIAAVGDDSPLAGTTYSNIGLNYSAPSPLNDSSQVAFPAILSNGNYGVFLFSPGGTVKVALTGDTVPGLTATFTDPIGALASPNLAINASGQVAFSAQLTVGYAILAGNGGSLTKLVASGDTAGSFTLTGVPYLDSFNNQQQAVFQSMTNSLTAWGDFLASPGNPIQTIASDGMAVPGTGGVFNTGHTMQITSTSYLVYNSADILINNEGDVAFRSAISGGTASSGYFRMLASGPSAGVLQTIVLQGQSAPGGSGTFGTINGAFIPGTNFTLGGQGDVAFASTVVSGSGAMQGAAFTVNPAGTLSKILLAGDPVPDTGGGTFSLQPLIFADAGNGSFTFAAGASGGAANQTILLTTPANAGNPVPTITAVSPASAIVGGASFTLTVTGTNFNLSSIISFNGLALPTTVVSPAQLTASIPAASLAAAGNSTVTVTNPAPGGGTSNALPFALSNPVPAITSLAPTHAPAGVAIATLTVNGTSFLPGSVVNFNGKSETTTFVSSTKLTATVPATDNAATGGTVPVTVSNPAPGGGVSGPQSFTLDSFTFSAPTTSATVTAGQQAQFSITLGASNSNGFPNTVSLTATGVPTGATATFSQNPVMVASSPVTVTMTVSTTARSSLPVQPSKQPSFPSGVPEPWNFAAACAGVLAFYAAQRNSKTSRRTRAIPLALLLISLAFSYSCASGGSSSTSTPGTPAGTSQITVTATSGTLVQTTQVTLTVN